MSTAANIRVGPLDPDAGESFGNIGDASRTLATARKLRRHHDRMYPPALRGALSRPFNEARSREVLDLDEVQRAVERAIRAEEKDLPEGFKVTGANVRGVEGRDLWLTYTFDVESGRGQKGAIRFTQEGFPRSFAAGEKAVRAERLQKGGLPVPEVMALLQTSSGNTSSTFSVADPEKDELRAEVETLRARLAEQTGERPAAPSDDSGHVAGEDSPQLEPWEGYEGETAAVIQDHLKASGDRELAERVVAYEDANQQRKGVLRVANEIIDATSAGE